MNILMYADTFGGNTTTFINNEIEYLSERHNLTFACIIKKDSGIFDFKNIVILPFKNSLFSKILNKLNIYLQYKDNNFKKELNSLVNSVKPDIIHCHFGKEALKILDNLENKMIPIVIHFHGYDASSELKNKLYVKRLKDILSRERVYSIFVAKYLRQNLINHGIAIKNDMILHCGINLSKFKRKNINKENKVKIFLQVSSLVEKKGHEYTIQAFAKFLTACTVKNYKLVLTGDGDRKEELIKLCKSLQISNYVKFLGYVTPQEAIELMQDADVFVHHSITAQNGDQEGIPTSIMEAMAMELPIISTIHSGIPELVIDGENGYLVKEKDVDTYALKMKDALLLGQIKKNKHVIENDFEINKHNETLITLYRNITV